MKREAEQQMLNVDRPSQPDVDDVLGIDWGSVAQDAFGVIHTAGKAVATSFGAGQAAQQLEQAESQAGILPQWAGGAAGPGVATVLSSDYVVVRRRGGSRGDVYQKVSQAVVTGGSFVPGNGYQSGEKFGKRYSFGFEQPQSVVLTLSGGKKMSMPDTDMVVFCGGHTAAVVGDSLLDQAKVRLANAQALLARAQAYRAPDVQIDVSVPAFTADDADGGTDMRRSNVIGNDSESELEIIGNDSESELEIIGNDSESELEIIGNDSESELEIIGHEQDTEIDILGVLPDFVITADDEPDQVTDSDYLYGTDVLGARPVSRVPARAQAKKTPAKVRVAPVKKGRSPHKEALARAVRAADRALKAGHLAQARARQYKPSQHRTLVPMTQQVVGSEIVLGVAQALTARQQAAVKRHTDALVATKRAVEEAQRKAARAIAASKAAGKKVAEKRKVVDKLLKAASPQLRATGRTALHGEEVLGSYDDDVIDSLCDDLDLVGAGVSPLVPAFSSGVRLNPSVTRVMPSATAAAPTSARAPSSGGGLLSRITSILSPSSAPSSSSPYGGYDASYSGDGSYPADGSTDSSTGSSDGTVPLPQRDVPLASDEARQVWQHVPDDGVVYDGTKGVPYDAVTSANRAYGGTDGYYYANGVDGHSWIRRQVKSDGSYQDDDVDQAYFNSKPYGPSANWGPLVGNPNGPLPNLQFAYSDGKWFWQSAHAPSWATAEADHALDELNQQITAANQAAADADAARQAQDAAEQQEAQDKSDAAIALAQQQADAQAAIQQQQLDLAQQAQDQQSAATQANLDAQEAQVALDYLKQHPEEMFAPGAQDDGGDGGEGPPPDDMAMQDRGGTDMNSDGRDASDVEEPEATPDESQVDWGG